MTSKILASKPSSAVVRSARPALRAPAGTGQTDAALVRRHSQTDIPRQKRALRNSETTKRRMMSVLMEAERTESSGVTAEPLHERGQAASCKVFGTVRSASVSS